MPSNLYKLSLTLIDTEEGHCSSLDGIWTHTIDALQHHPLRLTSSALGHSTTSTPYIYIKSKGIYQPENLMSNGSLRHDDAVQTNIRLTKKNKNHLKLKQTKTKTKKNKEKKTYQWLWKVAWKISYTSLKYIRKSSLLSKHMINKSGLITTLQYKIARLCYLKTLNPRKVLCLLKTKIT
jgi:hypothetical protein